MNFISPGCVCVCVCKCVCVNVCVCMQTYMHITLSVYKSIILLSFFQTHLVLAGAKEELSFIKGERNGETLIAQTHSDVIENMVS